MEQDKAWRVTINNKKTDLFCEQRVSRRGNTLIRARGPSEFDALTSLRCAGNCKQRLKYDKNI